MKTSITLLRALPLVFAFAGLGSAASAAEPLPNVIYIMDDEIGYYEPGFMGSKTIQTPNPDKLAAGGIVFRNLFAGT